jgi:hypothetical protein
LLKLIHRLHYNPNSAWAAWVSKNGSLAFLQGDLCGEHWTVLRSLLPLYQAVTSVTIGNGKGTTFWFDAWHQDDSMADKFQALFVRK